MRRASCPIVKTLALFFLIAGVSQSFAAWDGKSKTEPKKETIDKKEYYLIENEANLAWFRDAVNNVPFKEKKDTVVKINAKLKASLDMGGKLFVPIAVGTGSVSFGGIFDGNGYSISNLYLDSEKFGEIANKRCPENKPKCNAQNVGFVGVLGGGTVKNLNLINVDIAASASKGVGGGENNPVSVGPIVGFQKTGTVDNCYVSGKVLTSGQGNGIGGLVGNIWAGSITNSLSAVDILVSGNESYVGGVVGYVRKSGSATIDACAYDGNIIINSGDGVAGGVVGFYEEGKLTVSRTYFDTDVVANGFGKKTDSLTVDGTVKGVKNVNAPKVVCDLNGGEWKDNSCTKGGSWSVGDVHVVLNGTSRDNNDDIIYEIVFDANGGSFSADSKTSKFLKPGEKITADEISVPVHGDTVFGGWALTPDATGPAKDLGKVVTPKTVYAYWKTMIGITFDANGGIFPDSSTTKTKSVAEGGTIDIDGIELPVSYTESEKTYYFAGWGNGADATKALATLGTAKTETTFYAIWTEAPTYTVTFNTQGYGTSFVQVESGAKVSAPEAPEADGYTFGGWFTETKCTTPFDFDAVITESKVAYAKWAADTFAITYELDGGTKNKGNPDFYTIESETIKLKSPTKKGYIFEGWYYDADFSNAASQISKGSFGDKTFYAKWRVRTYTITYMAGAYGLGIVPAEEKVFDKPITLQGVSYLRDGYVQTGWSTEDGGAKTYDLESAYSTNAKLTLYPYWETESASIRYGEAGRLNAFSVAVQGRTLDIYGMKAGAKWAVYDMSGSLVAQGVAHSASSRVQIQKSGNYVVRMGGQFQTVRVR